MKRPLPTAHISRLPQRRLKVFFDGGCRPNPGKIEVAVVARGVVHFFDDVGLGTSSDAEWMALRQALQLAKSFGEQQFDLIGDSANVINQARGVTRSRTDAAGEHLAQFRACAASAALRRIRWVPRTQTLPGSGLLDNVGRTIRRRDFKRRLLFLAPGGIVESLPPRGCDNVMYVPLRTNFR